jgi:hypothetical protein
MHIGHCQSASLSTHDLSHALFRHIGHMDIISGWRDIKPLYVATRRLRSSPFRGMGIGPEIP